MKINISKNEIKKPYYLKKILSGHSMGNWLQTGAKTL